MLYAHDHSVSSPPLASRAQRVPLPLPSAPRTPAEGGRREAAPELADSALRATLAELQHGLMQPQAVDPSNLQPGESQQHERSANQPQQFQPREQL